MGMDRSAVVGRAVPAVPHRCEISPTATEPRLSEGMAILLTAGCQTALDAESRLSSKRQDLKQAVVTAFYIRVVLIAGDQQNGVVIPVGE